MEWEFNAEQVVKGNVAYGLEHFRRDLNEEVRLNMALADELQHARAFNLIYDMCYALATDRKLDQFLSTYAYDPPTCQFLREIEPQIKGNVEMLGAILQRMIMDGVEAGMSVDCAVGEAAKKHQAAAAPTVRS
ncbi:hypothetical protein [Azoarcus sp. KH32C]|uniref:hypothetical protein n=1 Tax=Azoarcus sp. KH32C TaxID=748247 RepID=UPI0002385CD8|nr:hypothetical protein [Azoarcus sp. KH32C]BAL26942.1 hypothetical protein AZKH_p0059 [Azoarcus sp. KH32C]